MTQCLAIIPARGGSQGLPGKNLKEIDGVSLVGLAVLRALEVPWIDKVVISTDARDIADEAVRHGAECMALRPHELATSTALALDVWQYEWRLAEKTFQQHYDLCVWLKPTSPCRRAEDFAQAYETYNTHTCDGVVAVSELPGSANPNKLLEIGEEGTLSYYNKHRKEHTNRQFNPDYYMVNGLIYLKDRTSILEARQIISPQTRAQITARTVVNIDNQFDLDFARWVLARG